MSQKKRPDTTGFEQKRIDVQQQDRAVVHGPKAPRPPSGRGNVFFVGLRGCGKTALGQMLAERLGRPFTDEPDWQQLAGLAKQGGQVAAISPELLAQEGVANLLQRGGKVFYIMTDAATIARRIGPAGEAEDISLREELFAELEALEPLCMQALHFIVPGTMPLGELADDVTDKLRITGDA